ncbi:porin family protein [Flavobacterium sp. PL02]|uniref:porin family protein n=1 Tax=Flavobacterium sp. PL02 TaxID=3088354 RepID=UPI002B238EFC|nr:porin family protein [Flavobacterium sp. PL02]MEA9412915.1 porin family protein [Flavobacterium sp. PL02]
MIKKITLSIIAVLAFGFANAQDVKFGAKGGINLSTLTGDIDNVSSKVGFQVGGFAEIKLSNNFFVQPEVLYSTQGAKSKILAGEFFRKNNFKFGYLNVPVMAKYYVADKFSLEAGPQIGFLVSAKNDYSYSAFGYNDYGKEDVKDQFKSIDFGVNLGAGYDFTENISAGVRYNLSLSNITDFGDGANAKFKNSTFSLSVGYKF